MRHVTCLVLVATLLPLGGCVRFTEPMEVDPNQEMDLSTLEGQWRYEDMPGRILDLEPFVYGPNTLQASFEADDSDPIPEMGQATILVREIKGRVVISVSLEPEDDEHGQWSVAAVDIGEDGSTLTLRWLDDGTVLEAARSGELAIRQPMPSDASEWPMPLLDVDGAALAYYLRTHAEVLDHGSESRFVRVDPDDSSAVFNQSFLPTAVRGKVLLPEGAGRSRTSLQWDPGRSATDANTMAYPYPGMPGSPTTLQSPFGGPSWNTRRSATPAGTDSAPPPDADTPGSLKGMFSALLFLVALGLVVGAGLNFLRRYQRRRSPDDAEVRPAEEAGIADHYEDSDASHIGRGELLRRYLLPTLLILAVALGPILYVAILLNGLSSSAWTLGLQPGAWGMLRGFAPYLLVLSIGTVIAIAEVVTTFPAFAAEALATRWAVLLVLFNGLGGMTVYSVVMAYASSFDHPLLRAVALAIGFAVLIRSRFVLARDLRAPTAANGAGTPAREGVSIDLGWLYARIQQLCFQRIQGDLLRIPRYATARVLEMFPDIVSLQRTAADSIASGDPAKSAERQARLDALAAEDVAPGIVRARLARFIAQTGGIAYTRFLLEHGGPERTT